MNLQSRILLFFVALLLGIQSISFWMIRQAIEDNARSSISSQLEIGERIFQRMLKSRGQRLADAAELLAADSHLISALALGDRHSVSESLDAHRLNAKARSSYVLSPTFDILSTSGNPFPDSAYGALRARAATASSNGLSFLASDSGSVRQFSLASIKDPRFPGWVAMEMPLDAAPLAELKSVSGFDATIVLNLPQGSSSIAVSSFLDENELADLSSVLTFQYEANAQALSGTRGKGSMGIYFPESLTIGHDLYGSRAVALSHDGGVTSYALLMESIDKAREPYTRLQWTLVMLGIGGIVTFAFGAFLLARSITRPIVELSKAAESFSRGDYGAALPSRSPGEVGELALSFDRMRMALGEREQRINKLAYWDVLTGLPNREQYREKLASLISSIELGALSSRCAIVHLDIDRIKNVNDSLGLAAGDEVLREAARRLSCLALPLGGLAARLSGDKFALLLPGMDADSAMEVASRAHAAFEASPAVVGPSRIDISAAMGICCIPEHASTQEEAMSNAEVAMYAAKQARAPSIIYDKKLDNASQDSLSLLSDLRDAITNGQLSLHYQAKADLATGAIVGAEALARWTHPTRGAMPPASFIPFAEQTGFIGQISRWAVHHACCTLAELSLLGRPIKISANISTRDLLDADFIASLRESLRSTGARPQLLCLEVTESTLMDHPDRSLLAMAAIRELGVELSIDDFGTGYSSLGYLRKMPINELKIDRVFILGLTGGSATDEKIVTSTIELAHGLSLRVVAEGVEDPRSFDKLRLAGCDQAQGYGISKPIPKEDFYRLLEGWTPSRMPGTRS